MVEKILLVSGDCFTGKILKAALDYEDYKVISIQKEAEGLDLIKVQNFALVIIVKMAACIDIDHFLKNLSHEKGKDMPKVLIIKNDMSKPASASFLPDGKVVCISPQSIYDFIEAVKGMLLNQSFTSSDNAPPPAFARTY